MNNAVDFLYWQLQLRHSGQNIDVDPLAGIILIIVYFILAHKILYDVFDYIFKEA